ncbi:Lactonase, 7-bladed beta-propeller-domain-containing protein [Aspergillus pseudonomiae]|uniref:Lactonase, 7-bladed beta-propeller-domain-containing protein n=1 Tax=Aspergillus pseudonomiae TaxID=1506151 RepID=A0A5N6IBB7_9EURO|nr:Lactonase, 7-bladed beta-propeller-domain-containing protein [Aspergillus pseudonomiae]KAB8263544.1 Lactonase, 7-bladed beta-propeller-domain-containing protein [Aspergillus pseudonomiae]KAE8408406.1 Lactonase, 7-bladed beta-propeller-domain-containing protein [Aspergillus pseudonomiae]
MPGFGLHQFVTSNAAKDRVYATSMSEPPRLFSWAVDKDYKFTHLDTVNITSSACYISDDGRYAFSAGGPTAHIHSLDDGAIGDEIQELYLIPEEDIDSVDKTRQAVLHGAHAFDVNINNKGFVPHLGMNSIFMYEIADNGSAQLLSINLSPTEGDGPRNSYANKNGKLLYVVTEHTQWLDVYEIGETQLRHVQRGSVIPDDVRGQFTFRSNTVQPSRDGKYLFASTRSWESPGANGYVAAFELDDAGYLESETAVTFYEAPVTLGSAGGLRVALWEDKTNGDPSGLTDYMYLSDTSEGWMFILGWTPSNKTLDLVASLHYPENATPYEATWLD